MLVQVEYTITFTSTYVGTSLEDLDKIMVLALSKRLSDIKASPATKAQVLIKPLKNNGTKLAEPTIRDITHSAISAIGC